MFRIIVFFGLMAGLSTGLFSQSPHGEAMTINCAACHSPEGWEITIEQWQKMPPAPPVVAAAPRFDHEKTGFVLVGQHKNVDCRACHETLVFEEAGTDCISCHTDLHQMTLGNDCARCHSPNSWLVNNILELHFDNGFPLLGNHRFANCADCHRSETALRFDRIGNSCINCHRANYEATTMPNHAAAGYSTDCVGCHDFTAPTWQWSGGGANHQFFPLTGGHNISDCTKCHIGGVYAGTPTECFACHAADFQATTSPDHEAGGFPTDCNACHTIAVGWQATDFGQHDQLYFPIFSGKHDGEWNQCAECHTTPGNFTAFSCVDCHEHNDAADLADEHDDVSGYSFSSKACYSCHPKGK